MRDSPGTHGASGRGGAAATNTRQSAGGGRDLPAVLGPWMLISACNKIGFEFKCSFG